VVFQEFRLLDHPRPTKTSPCPSASWAQHEKTYRDDVIELLKWVGLGDRLEARPATLSGGEKQRVAIARAVVVKPDLIIADEPTGNVDEEMGDRLFRLFRELNKRLGTTILIATHDLALVRKANTDVLRLADGMVSACPPPAGAPRKSRHEAVARAPVAERGCARGRAVLRRLRAVLPRRTVGPGVRARPIRPPMRGPIASPARSPSACVATMPRPPAPSRW
jgi:energy-coupling factor transporter ATP-binding protein EcfA2